MVTARVTASPGAVPLTASVLYTCMNKKKPLLINIYDINIHKVIVLAHRLSTSTVAPDKLMISFSVAPYIQNKIHRLVRM